MKKAFFVLISMFLFALPAFATAPVCLYQDVLSGPASGGEGGNGIYLSIYGANFGSSRGTSTVTVNGTAVAQYIYWGADPTGDRQQIGVQIASGTTSGSIVVTTPGGSCSNLSFTVRSGNIWFVGSTVDNSTPGSCSTMKAANSYSAPWGLTNYASTTESNYSYTRMRTPYTYYNCMSPGDTLVFLNGADYPHFDGRGWHSSLTLDNSSTTSTSFMTFMVRPGASVQLGGEGWATYGIRNTGAATYNVYSGVTLVGSGPNGNGLSPDQYDRFVGLTINCPSCSGPQGALTGGNNNEALGNLITAVSTDTAVLPSGSNKTYHDAYFQGNNFEFAWNRIYNTAAYNGFQINEDYNSGFYNFAIHDNDIADVNGSGINLSDIDPSSGYVQVYNNIIHHTGINLASDGGSDNPHSCIAVKGYGSATGVGTVEIYNNTMYDCSSYLNNNRASSGQGESCAIFIPANQLNVTTNLVNNLVYQPEYTYTSVYNVYICGDGTAGTLSGSNNIWYSASTPGSTAYATTVGTIENPLYVSATDGGWTHYELQSNSPAIGAGVRVGPVYSNNGTEYTYLTWDFNQVVRPSSPAIGALEYGSTSSEEQITVSAAPNPTTLEQPVTLTATVGQTGSSVPTGSINFLNGSVSLGQASLDSEGTATLVLSSLPVGSYAVVAAYSGATNYPSGESDVVTLQVLSATTTSLVASPNPVTAGQALALTATVEGSDTTSPSGTVSFLNGSTVLGTATLNASGVATLSTTSLAAGTYSLTAQYAGNASFLTSISAAVSATVNASSTTTRTSLVASPNPVTAGQALALTATVTGTTTPSGAVSFLNGSTVLGTATLNASGVATLSTTSLAAGTYSLTAQYTGNASFLSSTSAAVPVTVNALSTTTSLVASSNPVPAGQALALTATVQGSGSTAPAGTVSFLNGSTPLGTAPLNASGVATLSTASLAAGTYSLTAQYTGNASFLSSTSAVVPVTVNAQATVIVQSFSLNAGGSTSQTVQSGGTAVYTLGVSPAVGTTLPAINFVVSGLPAGATATFSPQTIPAGNGATNVTLSIQTSVQSAMLERNRKLGGGLVVALGILLLPFGGGIRRSGKSMLRLSYLVLFLAGAVSLAGLTGCAVLKVPGAFPSTSAQTYTVTVTSTAASLSQTTTVTLIVE